jgi:hypothetical protein
MDKHGNETRRQGMWKSSGMFLQFKQDHIAVHSNDQMGLFFNGGNGGQHAAVSRTTAQALILLV